MELDTILWSELSFNGQMLVIGRPDITAYKLRHLDRLMEIFSSYELLYWHE